MTLFRVSNLRYYVSDRITFIDRQPDSPRPDLFKCNLQWQDDSTLLICVGRCH